MNALNDHSTSRDCDKTFMFKKIKAEIYNHHTTVRKVICKRLVIMFQKNKFYSSMETKFVAKMETKSIPL